MSKIITGIFEDPSSASAAVDSLLNADVAPRQISVVTSEPVAQDAFAIESSSKIGEGAAIGAGAGGGIAAIVAGFTTVGAIASGGALLAAGPVVAALAGAGAGAAGGGLVGGLVGLGIPEHDVKFYEDALEQGSVLVGVDPADVEDDVVTNIFQTHEAVKVSSA